MKARVEVQVLPTSMVNMTSFARAPLRVLTQSFRRASHSVSHGVARCTSKRENEKEKKKKGKECKLAKEAYVHGKRMVHVQRLYV